jgi:copper chaperone CopZ
MSADIDSTRINRDFHNCVVEIIQNLTSVDGAKVKISLEVEAKTDDGFTQETVRTISENCQELGVRISGFEE